jgi:hypothetical protein
MTPQIALPAYMHDGQRIPITPAVVEQLARGTLKLERHGTLVPYRLTPAQRARFMAAQQHGYVVARAGDRALRNLYWVWCEIVGRPFICVDLRTRYAAVECDPLAANVDLSADAQHRIDMVWQRFTAKRARYSVAPSYCHCSKVPREYAEHVATRLWQISQDDRMCAAGGGSAR